MKNKFMSKKTNDIYDFPLDRIKDGWPFDPIIASDLFFLNSLNQYDSLYKFLTVFELIDSVEGETFFSGFFIKDGKSYYQGTDNKIYTLQNVPYSLIIYSAIKYTLTIYSKTPISIPYFGGKYILQYLMFTNIPVKQIIEENTFIKSEKRGFLHEMYMGFIKINSRKNSDLDSFFAKKDCKERLLYILLYSEISTTKAEALAENSCLQKDLSNIITYYKEISKISNEN